MAGSSDDENVTSDIDSLLQKPSSGSAPDFDTLFNKKESSSKPQNPASSEADETENSKKEEYPDIEKFLEDKPQPWLRDKQFYQKVLVGEGEISQRFHKSLAQFLNAENPEDRGMYRNRLLSIFWNFYETLGGKISYKMPLPKRFFLRFGILLPTMISRQQRETLSRIIIKNTTGLTVHYSDEWLQLVGSEEVNPLATDDDPGPKQGPGREKAKLRTKAEKAKGEKQALTTYIKNHSAARDKMERDLASLCEKVRVHGPMQGAPQFQEPYTGNQRTALTKMGEISKELLKLNRELQQSLEKYKKKDSEYSALRQQLNQIPGDSSDSGAVDGKIMEKEVQSLRQMAKITVGRKGNHFPLLMKPYFPTEPEEIATRENVIQAIKEVEKIDPGLFQRSFKGQINRIPPHIILLPTYGEFGVCWEPFERFNRATSRGRIAIPMYPKEVKTAVIYALADLRWQVAKEKAQHYWMQEGITGKYYQWFESRKLKGDVRLDFIENYILWITKESEGTQKLERELRGIFWRNIPFPQPLREQLSMRGFVYNELYKKDSNREKSAGY